SFIQNNHKYSGDEVLDKLIFLKNRISFDELFTLEIEPIKGDDTNGHVDNLVRFIDDENLVYFASTDKSYINYNVAKELKNQLKFIKKKSKKIKNIFPIFHDDRDIFCDNDKYYPYSKLNFLITSNCVVFPSITSNHLSILDDLRDLPILRKKYNINCEASLLECGGLHCLSMNI
ncbi:agmatine deiminase family protein, partial [Gammaproteobacteria bacterium]|nr:agmatine deiminase family protein [Gammaproteobacteria bacterium]